MIILLEDIESGVADAPTCEHCPMEHAVLITDDGKDWHVAHRHGDDCPTRTPPKEPHLHLVDNPGGDAA